MANAFGIRVLDGARVRLGHSKALMSGGGLKQKQSRASILAIGNKLERLEFRINLQGSVGGTRHVSNATDTSQRPSHVSCSSNDSPGPAVTFEAVYGDQPDDARTHDDVAQGASVSVELEGPNADSDVASRGNDLSQGQLIWLAAKLPMYSVGFIPLTVGAAAAYGEYGVFHLARFSLYLLFSVLVLLWLNLSNDAFDAETGVDENKRESVVNLTGSRLGVLFASFACLSVGLAGLLQGAVSVDDSRVSSLLALAVGCGYVYQCPPFRLSYKGVGEPLCFLAFGPLATTAFYLIQASSPGLPAPITATVMGASLLVGITTTLILFCSHFHQIEDDLAVGKYSPLVRLGTATAARVVKAGVVGLYALTGAIVGGGAMPLTCVVGAALTLPIGKIVTDFVDQNHMDKTKIFMAKYFCVRLHVAFGLALAISLCLGKKSTFS